MKHLSLLALALAAAPAFADRVPSSRVPSPPAATGTRPDITVPYLSNGRSTLGAYSVAVKITSSPVVSDKKDPGARPVYNLPFYGGVTAFGDRSNGVLTRPGAIPLPNR